MPGIELNGHPAYFEEHGTTGGEPVVLLHGGLMGGDSWAPLVPALDRWRVLVPDRRGHGRTPDVDGPLTYAAMADDTIAFLEQVAGGPAHLVGYSDGGIVTLLAARDRLDLVRSMVLIGTNFHHDGMHPNAAAVFDMDLDPMSPMFAPIRDPYAANSPDGIEHWPEFMAKSMAMGKAGPDLTVDDLRPMDVPALVIVGDDDGITHDHTVTLFESLPQGQLAVVPGTDHLLPVEKPRYLEALVTDFLADPGPTRWVPNRFPQG
jgi:pimeloyl-ACP methyl ester carboxylesterase